MKALSQFILVLCLSVSFGALTGCSTKAKKLDAPLTQQLEAGIKNGSASFDHSDYQSLLTRYVNPDTGRVDYKGLTKDRAKLDSYLKRLKAIDLATLPENEQLALLINAYNAFTLKLILDNFDGLKSIRDIASPWDSRSYTLGGNVVSLNNIEHGLIRPIYKDPRIHFAVNCASIGCPPLAAFAFTGAEINAQLDKVTIAFATNPSYVYVKEETLYVSKILDWYGDDFRDPTYKGHAKNVASYLKPFVTDDVKAFIAAKGDDPPVSFLSYDWNLNRQ